MKRILAFMLVIVVITAMSVPALAVNHPTSYPAIDEIMENYDTYDNVIIYNWKGQISLLISQTPFGYYYNMGGHCQINDVDYYTLENNKWVFVEHRASYAMDINDTDRFIEWAVNDIPMRDDRSTVWREGDGWARDPILPNGWPSSLPAPREEMASYIVLAENEDTWLYMTDDNVPQVKISDVNEDGERTIYFTMPDTSATNNIQRYRLNDGEWVYSSVGSLRSFSFDETLDIEYSTVDIYDLRGELFFPLPLWAEMEQVTQGEMVNLKTEMGGTMKILVVCGVGLMACLVVLSLFGKRSLIFRN